MYICREYFAKLVVGLLLLVKRVGTGQIYSTDMEWVLTGMPPAAYEVLASSKAIARPFASSIVSYYGYCVCSEALGVLLLDCAWILRAGGRMFKFSKSRNTSRRSTPPA